MNRRILVAGLAVAVLAVAGFGAWYTFIRDDSPAAVNLEDAIAAASSATAAATAAEGATGADPASSATPLDAVTSADVATPGTWNVVGGGLSFVGYRVEEELASVGATTAVGRTEAVTGSLEFDGTAISAVNIEADVTQLESDDSRRDRQLQRQAIETNQFPTATFVLTSPIAVDEAPAEGSTLSATVQGDLTIHGVTQPVALDLEGQVVDGRLVVVGSTIVQFADFDIDPPEALAVLSVGDEAVIEMQLVFERAS
ncbi:MAG: YceI family protein [Dehalococcoidia bacterium]